MTEAFLFDIGNVLVTFDFSRAIKRLAARSALGAEDIREQLTPLILDMESGKLSSTQFIETGMAAVGFSGHADDFAAAYTEIFEPHAPMEPVVSRLRKKFPLFLLSNTSALHLNYLRKTYAIFGHFVGGVYSHEAASLKPEAKIFRDVVERCRLDPARTLYFDDVLANTEAATRLGFQTFTYNWREHAKLEAFLRERGLL